MGFGVLAVVMLAVFAVRVARDRRRVSNGVYLLLGLMFAPSGCWSAAPRSPRWSAWSPSC